MNAKQALTVLALIIGAGVNPGSEASQPGAIPARSSEPARRLNFALASQIVTLDPRFATDAASARVNRLLYRALVDFDQKFNAVPSLATWVSPEPGRFRFTLNADRAAFSDGQLLTATDVEATYASVLDPSIGSPHRGALNLVEAVEVLDERTIEFRLTRHDPLFPGTLTIGILPADLIASGRSLARETVGSGPFELVEWHDENTLEIRRREDGLRVRFLRVPESTVRVLKLARGEVDVLQGDLPPELLDWLERRSGVSVGVKGGTNVAYLGFNLEDPATGNPQVRQAIAHALDRQAIVDHLLGGRARLASSLLVPAHWAGNPALPTIAFDPQLARSLLQEAGYGPERPLHLTYKTSSNPFRLRLGTVIAHQLSAVGIEVKLQSYDWGTFYADVKAGRFQMYSLAWVGIKSPDIFRYTMHSSAIPPAGANRGRFIDPEVDRLIESAEMAPRLADRVAYFHELQALLLQRLPVVPLWFEDQTLVYREGLSNYPMSQDGNYDGLISVRVDTR